MKLLEKAKQNVKDKYELTKSVKLVDVKGYLQKEYDRASIREKEIRKLEKQVEDMQELQLKYDAMLIVQEKTQKRIEELDDRILEYRATLKEKNEEIKFLREHIKDICSYKGLQEELTYDVPLDILKRVCIALDYLQQENKQLKKQLEYLRSGEYLNQLKFERNMLEDIVQNMEVSKEDKEFIDMTHRNTELLEENQELKDRINKAFEYIDYYVRIDDEHYDVLKEILKEDSKEK